MKSFYFLFVFALFLSLCSSEIFFSEEFNDGWENRWVISNNKQNEAGTFVVTAGKFFGDPEADKGLKTANDAKFYQISAQIKEFSNKDKDLVIQYSVKHEQNIDCGGAYLKLLPNGLDQKDFGGDSKYNIMFGPDICGTSKRVHAIFNYKEKNHLIKKDVKAESDEWTHLYTFILHPDQTFDILVDNKSVRKGTIQENWDLLPPKEILDPSVSKPTDWVDLKEIPDPAASKPEGWDDIPQQIPDKTATKPSDWDSELDGEWEPALIDNPEYKGEWKSPKIPNPEYKGEWVHPKIPNPDFYEDDSLGKYESHKYLGIEIWQVKSGTIFDNFLVTDSIETAKEWAEKTVKTQEGEKEAHKKDKEQKEAEAAAEGSKLGEEGDEQHDGDAAGLDDFEGFDAGEEEFDEEHEDL